MNHQTKTFTIKISGYVKEYLEELAKEAGMSVDDIAAYFFAQEVVHT